MGIMRKLTMSPCPKLTTANNSKLNTSICSLMYTKLF